MVEVVVEVVVELVVEVVVEVDEIDVDIESVFDASIDLDGGGDQIVSIGDFALSKDGRIRIDGSFTSYCPAIAAPESFKHETIIRSVKLRSFRKGLITKTFQ